MAAGPVVDKHLGKCQRYGTLEPFFSLAKAFYHHWLAFCIGRRQLGLSSRGSMALCSVRRESGCCDTVWGMRASCWVICM